MISAARNLAGVRLKKIAAVLRRGHTLGLLERLREHPIVTVAGTFGYIGDRQGSGKQELFGVLHADVREISEKIYADLTFEKLAYILRAQVKFVCKYAETYLLGQMLLQIPRELIYRPLLKR